MGLWWGIASLAWSAPGAEAELEIERGWVEVMQEQYQSARHRALDVLEADPHDAAGQILYAHASREAGLKARTSLELAAVAAEAPPWHDALGDLREAVTAEDPRAAKAAADALVDAFPDHPELLAPLWGGPPTLTPIGARHVRRQARSSAVSAAADVHLYRLWRLLASHPVEPGSIGRLLRRPPPRAVVTEALEARGEVLPVIAAPLTPVQRGQRAHAMLAHPPAAPAGPPSERVDIANRLGALYHQAKRGQDAVAMYQALSETTDAPEAPLGEAHAWLLLGEAEEARRAATRALHAATGPLQRDAAVIDPAERREAVAHALVARADANYRLDQIDVALADVALAHLLMGEVIDGALAELIEDATRASLAPVTQRYPASGLTWTHAQTAADEASDAATARAHLRDARFLAVAHTRGGMRIPQQAELYRDVLVELLLSEARIEMRAQAPEGARAAIVTTTLLLDEGASAEAWQLRGEIHEACGDVDAAFSAYARAHAAGAEGMEERLARTFQGVGAWTTLVDNVDPSAVPSTRSAGWSVPELGAAFPELLFDTPTGQRSTARLGGRYLLITMYEGDCEACVLRLPYLGTMAQAWRESGRDALAIGIDLAPDPTHLERVVATGAPWGVLVHEPALGPQLGISEVPVTFVVDPAGITRVIAGPEVEVEQLDVAIQEEIDDAEEAP